MKPAKNIKRKERRNRRISTLFFGCSTLTILPNLYHFVKQNKLLTILLVSLMNENCESV
ncbi:MAG: hypothetical protein NC090_00820 [Anaeroplasma bactoclasticum]|nr:hypothetical protein [Anaeroplasma bactoclasticum]